MVEVECSHSSLLRDRTEDDNGYSPFLVACRFGQLEIARYLLECDGALLRDRLPVLNTSPLYLASMSGQMDLVRYLVEDRSCDVREATAEPWGFLPIHTASFYGHMSLVSYFVDQHRVDVDTPSHDGWTPFLIACERGQLELIRWLVARGCDIHCETTHPFGAVFIACDQGHGHVVDYLVRDLRMSINVQASSKNRTPLFRACKMGYTVLVRKLLGFGAVLDDDTKNWLLRDCENSDIARLLVIYGAKLCPCFFQVAQESWDRRRTVTNWVLSLRNSRRQQFAHPITICE